MSTIDMVLLGLGNTPVSRCRRQGFPPPEGGLPAGQACFESAGSVFVAPPSASRIAFAIRFEK